ncbi:unnamed protein product [Spirodela intermedia]|uniref:Uncharacterized protein n=1 Tax=Spirodela intermedia TaxID=51605 RepID=A0A7I8IK04_SPIIN|nr:unnamed protein product [Spirodela intermedia]CAA6658219.1 unnamed protein product [Spirodela intermedia]
MYLCAAISEAIVSSRAVGSYERYERLEEDPEERRRLQTKFLIYKTLAKADAVARRRPPFFSGLRLRRLQVKVGRRLISGARTSLRKRLGGRLEKWRLSNGRKIALPPVFC